MSVEAAPRISENFTLGRAKKWLSYILRSTDLTVMLHGAPGIGKTEIVEQIAKEEGYELIVCSLLLFDPTEMKGIPYVEAVSEEACGTKKTIWAVPDRWPTPAVKYKGPKDAFELGFTDGRGEVKTQCFRRKNDEDLWDEVADPALYRALRGRPDFRFRKGILFLDEFNVAPSLVQCVTLKLVDSGRIETYELPKEWRIVVAGNLGAGDGAYVSRTSSAVNNRFVHFFVEPNHQEWVGWARENGIHRGLIGFIQAFPDLLSKVPERGEMAFPTPRMWANLSKLLNAGQREFESWLGLSSNNESTQFFSLKDLSVMVRECGAAFVGLPAAVQLAAFLELSLEVDTERIIVSGDLTGLRFNGLQPDQILAVVGSCAWFLKAAEKLGQAEGSYYANFAALLRHLSPEYQLGALQMLEDDMLERLSEEDGGFYMDVLSMVESSAGSLARTTPL